MEIAIPRYLT